MPRPAAHFAAGALAALLAAPLFAPLHAQQLADLGVPTIPNLVLAQDAAQPDLVAVFADYYGRHPIGSTLAPSTLRLLPAEEAASLPALQVGQRYAETEGLIVKVDAAYKLVGIARRAPATTAAAPEPAPAPAGDATANANANANSSVNITINGHAAPAGEAPSGEAISVAEAEARNIRIPRGHQPDPGACRLWIPGTPPGQQPRGNASCDQPVPEGALLIRG